MEFTGSLDCISRDYDTGEFKITFTINEVDRLKNEYDYLKKCQKLQVKAVKFRQKRSLDANAYAWVLMSKIADAVDSSKEEVYEDMLQKYGSFYKDDDGYITITVKKSVNMSRIDGHWKYLKDNGKFASYLMIKGSSEYDTKEMSQFIDRIIEEAKDLGIETATPDEIERMKQEWHINI